MSSPENQPSALPPAPYAPAPYAPRPSFGAASFALGFLSFIGLPYVNLIVAGIVMAAIYPSQAKKGETAAKNARAAANWGLTMVLVMVIVAGVFFTILASRQHIEGFLPLGIAPIIWGVLCVVNLIVIISGLVGASAGRVVRTPAIPFIRARVTA